MLGAGERDGWGDSWFLVPEVSLMSWEGCWPALSATSHRTLDSQGPEAKRGE